MPLVRENLVRGADHENSKLKNNFAVFAVYLSKSYFSVIHKHTRTLSLSLSIV
jgi:hypothetical protein